MPYSQWLLDVVFDEFRGDRDVPVRPVKGWQTRGRDYADHQGVMDHHIGGPPGSSYAGNLAYIVSGASFAPVANIVTGSPYAPDRDDFPIHIVAAGRANHAGPADPIRSIEWIGTRSASTLTIGIEHYSTWGHATGDWHPRHLEIQRRLDACLLEHMGQSYVRRCDHKEWAPNRKSDRHGIDTAKWDRDLRDLMAERADAPDKEDEVTPEDRSAIAAEVADILRPQLVGLAEKLDSVPREVWGHETTDLYDPDKDGDKKADKVTMGRLLRWARKGSAQARDLAERSATVNDPK